MPNNKLLLIGSSTGGPKVLEELFAALPVLNSAIVVVQHITPMIDQALVTTLSRFARMPVRLAENGAVLSEKQIYLAPGGIHLSLRNNKVVQLFDGERVNSVRPSIDVAMKSLCLVPGNRLVGVILTGMGRDGAEGIAHIKEIGGTTIAQDQSTSVIYGMPKAALETGKIDFVLPTLKIAEKISELLV